MCFVYVGSSWAVLEALPGQTPVRLLSLAQLPSLAQLLSWPLETFCHSCWLVVVLFVCLVFFKVCQSCQLVLFPLFSCYIWRIKVGCKARNFFLLFCPSSVTVITFYFSVGLPAVWTWQGLVYCIWSGSCARGWLESSKAHLDLASVLQSAGVWGGC